MCIRDRITLEQATQIYDLFEAVVETELESLRAMLISIDVGSQVEVSFCVSAAEPVSYTHLNHSPVEAFCRNFMGRGESAPDVLRNTRI